MMHNIALGSAEMCVLSNVHIVFHTSAIWVLFLGLPVASRVGLPRHLCTYRTGTLDCAVVVMVLIVETSS
jgi:hypothetical protein